MNHVTVLSLEQALALPYATERMVHLGWRVIRVEAPGLSTKENAGDPNRYIGEDLGFHDLHSYFIAPNIGKEAITINLKKKEGQALLYRLIRDLNVDVFLCNTLPKRYEELGISYTCISKIKPDIIWCGISAFGPDYPDKAGYDPAMQALMGFTYLTGEPDGKPVPCGIPIIDLKAGDEAFTQVILALLNKNISGIGKEINISMAQCAASWLITALPQLEFVHDEKNLHKRSGSEHRSFIPCNIYPTKDGMVYLAIGNDSQWKKFTMLSGFESLSTVTRATNEGRMLEKESIYCEIGERSKRFSTNEFVDLCLNINLSVSPVHTIKEVAGLNFLKGNLIGTRLPDGRTVSLFPSAVATDYLKEMKNILSCAPKLGEQNAKIYGELGVTQIEMKLLEEANII